MGVFIHWWGHKMPLLLVHSYVLDHVVEDYCGYQGRMEGGFLGFQETPFDSKTISKITCLINILASYAYLSVNTI